MKKIFVNLTLSFVIITLISIMMVATVQANSSSSHLAISEVKKIPDTTEGTPVSISGKITSKLYIDSVTIGIYPDKDSDKAYAEAEAKANLGGKNVLSYSISSIGVKVKTDKVPTGKRYFRVTVTDASGATRKFGHEFNVTVNVREHTVTSDIGVLARSGAGTGCEKVGGVARGSSIKYTQTKSADNFTWIKIESGSKFEQGSWPVDTKILTGCWVAIVK
jgi:hypothetical protein